LKIFTFLPILMRVRITFSKSGSLRYIGHLDLYTLWERAARRAELPLAYTKAFHPQPRINFAAPLPLGFSSRAEIMDMRLEGEEIDLARLPDRLNVVMPSGIEILSAEGVDENAPALQTQVIAAEYEVSLSKGEELSELRSRISEIMSSSELLRIRREKQYDLRPLIDELTVNHTPIGEQTPVSGLTVFMRLSARASATGRPEEVLDALGVPLEAAHIERTRLIFQE
jgi:radical SAM-linked protein